MSSLIKYIIFYALSILFLRLNAMNLEDLQQKYVEVILECAHDFPLTPQDIEQLKNKQLPENQVVKCLFACAYKKTGMMDDQGMLSVNGVNELTQKYFSDDKDKLKKAQEFNDACAGVNNEAVSDGQKGCDRAALIFKCTIEKSPQILILCSCVFKMHITSGIALIFVCGYVYGLTDEEVKKNFIKDAMICTKDIPVDMTDLLELEQLKPPTKHNVKCLLACAYKRMGTMNKQGMFDIKEGYKFAEKVKEGDEKRLENGIKLADTCIKVNDVKVSDGEKGCERASLMFKCVVENAPKLGFKI